MPSLPNGSHSLSSGIQKTVSYHPLASLSAEEIRKTSTLIQSVWPGSTDLWFKLVTLLEPPKDQVLEYLEAEDSNSSLPWIDRKAFVNYYLRNTVSFSLMIYIKKLFGTYLLDRSTL